MGAEISSRCEVSAFIDFFRYFGLLLFLENLRSTRPFRTKTRTTGNKYESGTQARVAHIHAGARCAALARTGGCRCTGACAGTCAPVRHWTAPADTAPVRACRRALWCNAAAAALRPGLLSDCLCTRTACLFHSNSRHNKQSMKLNLNVRKALTKRSLRNRKPQC